MERSGPARVVLHLRIDSNAVRRLDQLAAVAHRSRNAQASWLVEQALRELDTQEATR